jgi:hypothetical protein
MKAVDITFSSIPPTFSIKRQSSFITMNVEKPKHKKKPQDIKE